MAGRNERDPDKRCLPPSREFLAKVDKADRAITSGGSIGYERDAQGHMCIVTRQDGPGSPVISRLKL